MNPARILLAFTLLLNALVFYFGAFDKIQDCIGGHSAWFAIAAAALFLIALVLIVYRPQLKIATTLFFLSLVLVVFAIVTAANSTRCTTEDSVKLGHLGIVQTEIDQYRQAHGTFPDLLDPAEFPAVLDVKYTYQLLGAAYELCVWTQIPHFFGHQIGYGKLQCLHPGTTTAGNPL